MKVGIICSANIMYSPYLIFYTKILDKLGVEYEIIIWNKIGKIENQYNKIISYNKYYDFNSSKFKKAIANFRYSRFVLKNLKNRKYNKVIVLTAQSGIFISRYLKRVYKDKYILDIRDYSNAKYYMCILNRLVENSYLTSISSKGYLKWLPESEKYIISHNTTIEEIKRSIQTDDFKLKQKIKVSTIGAIRSYNENKYIIDLLKNNDQFELEFIGRGICENALKDYCEEHSIKNIIFKGEYDKKDEKYHYLNAGLINLYTGAEAISTGLLANRLYNACIYGKPIIIEKNSYMSEIVEKYNLGISISSNQTDLDKIIKNYISKFNKEKYDAGRKEFLECINKDEIEFEKHIIRFINNH